MNTEDRAFFGITGVLGTILEYERIIVAQVVGESFLLVLGKACLVAFISGFIGLFGKIFAQYIWKKLKT
jgi:hypothetical protein